MAAVAYSPSFSLLQNGDQGAQGDEFVFFLLQQFVFMGNDKLQLFILGCDSFCALIVIPIVDAIDAIALFGE